MAVTAAEPSSLNAEDEQRLLEFGDLLATAITSIEDRAKLATQASSDPLTGLANHRTLQQRLAAEVARAVRHDHPLSVAVIDVDHFKQINDVGGHEIGDEMLIRVARCLDKLARAEDTLGRAGGDEFTWVLPETTREQALIAVERARRVITEAAPDPFRLTVSAGICDISLTQDPAELIHLADGALYWSKARGRDQCWVYDPAVINELSAQERAERLERSHALLGLRALARAIDAKDPATREHSERVSALVGSLARMAGWSPEESRLLLCKTEPLTAEEWAQITDHAELSARIVEGVLTPAQVEWIRSHHERPDGEGYPDGLSNGEISDGAGLLAVADAWDVMTISRPYSLPKSIEEALAECIELVGSQFTENAVQALTQLHSGGELGGVSRRRKAVAS
jgi:diguanylate cyclase (GGDEF)-like protein